MAKSMGCAICGCLYSKVIETRVRENEDGEYVLRRRACKECSYRWTTYEFAAEDVPNFHETRMTTLKAASTLARRALAKAMRDVDALGKETEEEDEQRDNDHESQSGLEGEPDRSSGP